MEVSVRELKSRLSEYLRRVQAGESLYVTLRGRRIARLQREPGGAEASPRAGVDRLAAQPWIRMGQPGARLGLEQPVVLRGKGPSLTDILLADRAKESG